MSSTLEFRASPDALVPEECHAKVLDLPRRRASVTVSMQRPITQSAFTDKLTAAAWRDKWVYVLVGGRAGRQDRAMAPSVRAARAA